MKKIIIAALVFATLLSLCVSAETTYYSESDVQGLMSTLGIMNGYEDGNFYPENPVTRAEFAKMAVTASQYRDTVSLGASSSPFRDVSYLYWAAPYIKVASSGALITGYPDSTFLPEKSVSYEEAVTVAVKLLGYTDADFSASWPYGQLGVAQRIGILDGVNAQMGEALTRGQVRTLFFNVLMTNTKGSDKKYIDGLGYSLVEDAVIIATSNESTAVAAGRVLTSQGTYKTNKWFDNSIVGRRGDIVINDNNEFILFFPTQQSVETYDVYSVLSGDILVYSGGNLSTLKLDSGTTAYYNATKTTLGSITQSLEMGYAISLYKDDSGTVEYISVSSEKMLGPVTNSGSFKTQLSVKDGATVIRDGKSSDISAVSLNDVVYYSPTLNILWAYSKKVTGIFEAASPSRETPDSVTISGTSYTIETAEAMQKLSAGGAFALGDSVTVFIGKSGGIADVLSSQQTSDEVMYGYVLETGSKVFSDTDSNTITSPYAKIAFADGTTNVYKTKSIYSSLLNSVVQLKFDGSVAALTKSKNDYSISGKFSASAMTLGSKTIAENVGIIDISTTLSNETGSAVKVYPQRLDGAAITSSSVLYCKQNSAGEIVSLILKNVTGDCSDYGIITSHEKNSKQFTVLNSTQSSSYSLENYTLSAGQPVEIKSSSNSLAALKKLGATVTSVTETSVVAGTNEYALSDKVIVYDCTKTLSGIYNVVPLSSVVGLSRSQVKLEAYYDKLPANGGRIRVIKAVFN